MIKYKLFCKKCKISFDSWFASSMEYEKLKNKKIKEYQKFIKNNFEYVGENFTYEARSIHYNKRRKKKGIFGSASNDQIKELKEEGIKIETIPWIEDNKN